MDPTKINRTLAFKDGGFNTLADALEYAAKGETGYNFYNERGQLSAVISYADLYRESQTLARQLLSTGYPRGSRVAIIGETGPMFVRFFFACQYAGYLPVALPADVAMGGRDAYVTQLSRMIEACGASIAVAPDTHESFLADATAGTGTTAGAPDYFESLPLADEPLVPLGPDEAAYLQYTSGSTQFPRGVEVTQRSVLNNLTEIARYGLHLSAEDRMVSWLPLFHDMGLVGFVLLPLAGQLSVDLLSPRSFAMRPRLWLKIISDNGGTVTSSPPFGYGLCAKRLRPADRNKYDLSRWRAACVGAERINPEPLAKFAEALAPSGFRPQSFVACYGMAECALAISFAPLDLGLTVDWVDSGEMAATLKAVPVDPRKLSEDKVLGMVDCGLPLPSYEVTIRDEANNVLGDRQCGRIVVRGPSVMRGYFENPQATRAVLSEDGWLDTGDIGYRIGKDIVVTARRKDVIIINGRNIWPQDLEHLAEASLPNSRIRNVSAFSAKTSNGEEMAVLVVESRENDPNARQRLVKDLQGILRVHHGVNVFVDLVEPGTLPRTSSGKLSRVRARNDFIERSAVFSADATAWKAREAYG